MLRIYLEINLPAVYIIYTYYRCSTYLMLII